MRAAPLTPTCVAAPAGPIGSAAPAAPAQRRGAPAGTRNRPRVRPEAGRRLLPGRASRWTRAPTLAMPPAARSCERSASAQAGSARPVRSRPGVAERGSPRRPRLRRQPPPRARRACPPPRPETERQQRRAVPGRRCQSGRASRVRGRAHARRPDSRGSGGRRRPASHRRSGPEGRPRSAQRHRFRPRAQAHWGARPAGTAVPTRTPSGPGREVRADPPPPEGRGLHSRAATRWSRNAEQPATRARPQAPTRRRAPTGLSANDRGAEALLPAGDISPRAQSVQAEQRLPPGGPAGGERPAPDSLSVSRRDHAANQRECLECTPGVPVPHPQRDCQPAVGGHFAVPLAA